MSDFVTRDGRDGITLRKAWEVFQDVVFFAWLIVFVTVIVAVIARV